MSDNKPLIFTAHNGIKIIITKMTEEECDELIRRVRATKSTLEEEPMICEVKAGKYKVRFRIEQEDDGSYFGYCPQLKGCVSDGETLEELRQNLEDAVILYINSLLRHGEEIPAGEYIEVLGKEAGGDSNGTP